MKMGNEETQKINRWQMEEFGIYYSSRWERKRPVAEVAELADAHGSGPCGSNTLWVRLPSSAL